MCLKMLLSVSDMHAMPGKKSSSPGEVKWEAGWTSLCPASGSWKCLRTHGLISSTSEWTPAWSRLIWSHRVWASTPRGSITTQALEWISQCLLTLLYGRWFFNPFLQNGMASKSHSIVSPLMSSSSTYLKVQSFSLRQVKLGSPIVPIWVSAKKEICIRSSKRFVSMMTRCFKS